MRLPLIPPDQLTPEQKALYDRNREQIAQGFTSFKTTTEDGALLGPWGVFLHEPAVGQAHYDQIAAVTALKRLPGNPPSRLRFWSRVRATRQPTNFTRTRRPPRRRA